MNFNFKIWGFGIKIMQLKFCKNEKASILIWSLLQTCFHGEIRADEIGTLRNDPFVVTILIVSALGASIWRRSSFLILRVVKNYNKGFNCYVLTDFSPNVTVVVTHQNADLIQHHVRRRRRSGVGDSGRVERSFRGHVDGATSPTGQEQLTGEQHGSYRHRLEAPQMVEQDTLTNWPSNVHGCRLKPSCVPGGGATGSVSCDGLWPRPQVMITASPSEWNFLFMFHFISFLIIFFNSKGQSGHPNPSGWKIGKI